MSDDYRDIFSPRRYLEENFIRPNEEDLFALDFIVSALARLPDNLRTLEFGAGPALYAVIALARKAKYLHVCDYVPANLDEIQLWLDGSPDAFGWRDYIELVLHLEGSPATPTSIDERSTRMREMVQQVSVCDAHNTGEILTRYGQYDLISAMHCTDVAAKDFEEWVTILAGLCEINTPQGWLLLGITTGSTVYTENDVPFPCLDLTAEDVKNGLARAGYNQATLLLGAYQFSPEHVREYSGMILSLAQKIQ